jgi:hypothetical protein
VASFLTQALFALNETYFMSDKTAVQEMATFPFCRLCSGTGEVLCYRWIDGQKGVFDDRYWL